MAIITLTSDSDLKDYYIPAIKGKILNYLPDVNIVDITHRIKSFDIIRAAFVIKNCFPDFPKGSVHIIDVDTEASVETPHIAVLYREHFFLGADNGMFTLICDEPPQKIVEIDIAQDSDYFTFPARDVFAKAACHLASGKPIEELGEITDFKSKSLAINPVVTDKIIRGTVIYVDSFENLITNISETLFRQKVKNKAYTIFLPNKTSISSINRSYKDVPKGEIVAFFNTSGLLELAMNNGNLAGLMDMNVNSVIRIELE